MRIILKKRGEEYLFQTIKAVKSFLNFSSSQIRIATDNRTILLRGYSIHSTKGI